MSKLSELVTKVRNALAGTEDEPERLQDARPFDWNPTPMAMEPAKAARSEPPAEEPREHVVTDPAARLEPPPAVTEPRVAVSEPPRPRTRGPADVIDGRRLEKVKADVTDFAIVYKESGITPPAHGYGVEKVAEMLESRRLAPLAGPMRATAVLAALEAAGVPVRDVIQDAILRDKALAAFEARKALELQDLKTRNETRIQKLKGEIDAFLRERNGEIDSLRKAAEDAAHVFTQLQVRKRREEDRLQRVVAHFVEALESAPALPRNTSSREARPRSESLATISPLTSSRSEPVTQVIPKPEEVGSSSSVAPAKPRLG